MVYNGEFELVDGSDGNGTPRGWDFDVSSRPDGSSPNITLLTARDSNQHTVGGRYVGRIVSRDKEAAATLGQSLTLCPGATYAFKAWARVLRPLAQCEATFKIGDEIIGVIQPTATWSSGIARLKTYTADKAEVLLQIGVQCYGSLSSVAPGTIDFDDVSLERVFS